MKLSNSIFLAVLSLNSLFVQQDAQANLFRLNIDETGGDVVFSFDGSIDLTGAVFTDINGDGPDNMAMRSRFNSGSAGPFIEFMGRDHVGIADDFEGGAYRWEFSPNNIKVPAFGTNVNDVWGHTGHSFGGGYTVTGSGDLFGINMNTVYLPSSFSSGDTVTGQMTFANTTFSEVGITAGTYNWGLGNNNMEIVANTAAVPGPLPILGVPVVFYYFKKLKEKTRHQRGQN